MNRTVLVIGIIFLLIGFSSVSSIGYNTKESNTTTIFNKTDSTFVLLDEDFSGTFPPEGWETYTSGETGSFDKYNLSCCDSELPCIRWKHSGQGGQFFNFYITSKAIDASNYEQCIIKFYYGAFNSTDYAKLKYRRNETSPWIEITSLGDDCYYYENNITYGPEGCGEALQIRWHVQAYIYYLDYICIDDVKIIGNNAPYPPSNPTPCNGTINMSICPLNLSWTDEGDPDGDKVTYDVYFGNDSENMHQKTWNQSEKWFFIKSLNFNKTYYWYIVAWDEHGAYTVGPLWNFRTEKNLPPNPAKDPYPPDGATIPLGEGVILCWNGSDPNLCDSLLFDLYFDDVNPPLVMRMSETYVKCWEIPFELSKYKTYYWKVDTYDKSGEFTEGPVWSFIVGDNHPPSRPIIDGPTHGKVGLEYTYTFVSADPENHSIKYLVNWGDGTEDSTDLLPNSTIVTLSHSWDTKGTYIIKAKAIDEHNAVSGWGNLTVTIPRDKAVTNNILLRLLEKFPLLQRLWNVWRFNS
jgi:hypothetical protein